jgi:hypothetical protein
MANREMLGKSIMIIDRSLQNHEVVSPETQYEVRRDQISGEKTYVCRSPECHGKEGYDRRADCERHHREMHPPVKVFYRCSVNGCTRRGLYSRKGDMDNHLAAKHGAGFKQKALKGKGRA